MIARRSFVLSFIACSSAGAQPAPPPAAPPPSWGAPPAVPAAPGAPVSAPSAPAAHDVPASAATAAAAPEAFDPWRLAVQTESAFGVSGPFYNHLAGARLDRRFLPTTSLGVYLGYANLKGKDGRAHNVLAYVQLDQRLTFGSVLALPLRFATGYLPNNGPVLRLATGLALELDGFELVFDVIAPTFWVSRNETVMSLDVAAEAAWTF